MQVSARSRGLSIATAVAVTAGLLLFAQPGAAVADTAPPAAGIPATVSTDVLPTVQIDGVVWDQEIVGNTVYAGGEFTTARPAGAAAGVNTVPRGNLLSYDVRTGVLITSFAPHANARIRNMALSPDGSRLYVVGNFTSIAGQTRYRVASFDTATGALTTFRPVLNGKVNAVTVTNDTVYLVGGFTTANNVAVTGAAAFGVTGSGVLRTAWAPKVANGQAVAVVAKPDSSKVVLGGYFESVNGSSNPGFGLAAVDGATGALLPWNANSRVRNATSTASITSLDMDADGVYGTGQTFGPGTLEGTFYASWANGDITWVEDCLGDTYSAKPIGDVVYTTGHAHYCGNIAGFLETKPRTHHRALAFTKAVQGTITRNPYGSTNWEGTPRPALLDWFPDINTGTYTGLNQGGWSVGGNSDYVLYGGEFTRINNTSQQGLVRFASNKIAPNDDGPRLGGASYVPNVISVAAGTARISWQANHDRDNAALTYDLIRNGVTGAPVYTTTVNSNFYTLPAMGFTDTGLTPGATYTYRIRVTDPFGNVVHGENVSVTIATSGSLNDYARTVLDDSPVSYWRLGETSGPNVYDWAGAKNATAGAGVTFRAAGAIGGDTNTAAVFSGTSTGLVATQTSTRGPDSFAVEAWFTTTSSAGGKIVGFGDKNSGNSSNYDRHVYMDSAGRVLFGVYPGAARAVQSATGFNDGQWHHVVANLGATGMELYVDGVKVAQRADATSGQAYTGYWRIGGDTSWSGAPYFTGTIDEVAVYGAPLGIQQVNEHIAASGRTSTLPGNAAPTASFTTTVDNLSTSVNGSASSDSDGTIASYAWQWGDGTTGTGVTASHTYTAAGTYTVGLTVTDNAGATNTTTRPVTVAAAPGNVAPTASFTATVTDLSASVNGSASSDADGTIASHSWQWGDGGTGTGATATHTYAAGGTYQVTLTVTDNQGATGTATRSVTVTAPPGAAAFATDSFQRSVTGGLGTADAGGPWTVTGGASNFSVSGGTGNVKAATGGTSTGYLNSVSSTSTEIQTQIALDRSPTGTGTYVSVFGRTAGTAAYGAKLRFYESGAVTMQATGGTTIVLPGITYVPNEQLQVRVQVTGTSPTTVRAKVWRVGGTEPASWQSSGTSTTAGLQTAGAVGVQAYLPSGATNGPVTVRFDNLWAGAVQ